jgi:hypothetical protein
MRWPQFLEWVRDTWAPGEHWAVVAPTGEGKTTFIGGLAKTRRWVLGLDIKGGDRTLTGFGWERITNWPLSRKHRKKMQDEGRLRVLIGGTDRTAKGRADRRLLLGRVLESLMADTGWTVLAPDLMALTHRTLGRAEDQMRELLILARDADVSIVTDWQRPSNVPVEAGDQATYLAVGYTRDKRSVERLAEMMGRSYAELRGAINALGELPHGWLVVSRRPREPIILTKPEI